MNRQETPDTVREAVEDDRSVVASMLARAFSDDAVTVWLDTEPEGRIERAVGSFEQIFDWSADGMRLVTADLAAASLWDPPSDDTATVDELPPELPHRVRLMLGTMAAHRPGEPHWYLKIAGCAPDRQGEGLGAAVVLAGIDRAGGLPVYLETAKRRNIGFYERLGFTVTGEFDMPENGPHLWSMLRRG